MWYWMAVVAASMAAKPDSTKTLPSVSVRDYRLSDQPAGSSSIPLNRRITSGFPGMSAAEIANQDGGVVLRLQGPGLLATSQFRGGQASQTAVFWEGIPIGNAMLGQQDLALLPAALLGEIRLTPGSQGGTLGNQAIAGSLHFTQSFLSNSLWTPTVTLQTGSWGQTAVLAALEGAIQNQRLKIAAFKQQSFNDFQVRDYFSFTPGFKRQTNARQDLQAARLSLAGDLAAGFKYRYHLLYTSADRQIPPTLTQQNSSARQQDHAVRQVIQFDRTASRNRLRGRMFHQWERLNYQDDATQIFSDSHIQDWGMEVFWSRSINKLWELSAQSSLQRQQVYSTVYEAGLNRISGQLQANYQSLRNNFQFTGSVRVEQAGTQFSGLQPYLGMSLGDSAIRWTAQVSGHFRHPTLNDLFWIPGGNRELKPEQGWGGETGLAGQKGIVKFNLSTYWRSTQQLIFWRPLNAGIWSPVNLSDALAVGIEARIKLRWRQFEATTSGQWGRFTRNEGKEKMPYIPTFTATQWLEQRLGSWHLALSVQYRSSVEDPEGINGRLPGFVIADFFLKRGFLIGKQSLAFSAMIRNFTNEEYQVVAWRAMPGINWGLALQWSLHQISQQ